MYEELVVHVGDTIRPVSPIQRKLTEEEETFIERNFSHRYSWSRYVDVWGRVVLSGGESLDGGRCYINIKDIPNK